MEFYGLPPHEKKSRKRAHDDVEEIKLDEEEDDFDDEDEEKPDINVIEKDHKNFERVRKICEYD